MTVTSSARVAVYLDIDSLIPQVEYRRSSALDPRDFFTAANTGQYLKEIEDYARGFGEVVLWEAVGLWLPESRQPAARLLSKRGALLRHMPPFLEYDASGKNAADILLAARIIDSVQVAQLDVIVLGANDKDFEPLAQELKRLGKVVVAISPPTTGRFQKELLEWAFDDWKELTVPKAWQAAVEGGESAQKYLDGRDPALAKLSSAAIEQARPSETVLAASQQIDLLVVATHFFSNWGAPQPHSAVVALFARFWSAPIPSQLDEQYRVALTDRFLYTMAGAGALERDGDDLWAIGAEAAREFWVDVASRKLYGAEQHICSAKPQLLGLEKAADEAERIQRAAAHVRRLFRALPTGMQNRAKTEALVDQLRPTGS